MRPARPTVVIVLSTFILLTSGQAQNKVRVARGTGPTSPSLKSLAPDVVIANQQNVSVTLQGTRLSAVSDLRVIDCSGKSTLVHLDDHVHFRVALPPAALTKIGVLRVGLESGTL